ncbi:MAG TPA: glycosyltransferase 61 family protein [Caulobacteraceae bacterium]
MTPTAWPQDDTELSESEQPAANDRHESSWRIPVRGWRPMAENIFGYNMPERFSAEDIIRDVPMDILPVPGAFISRREIERPENGQWVQRGGVYDAKGVLLPEFDMIAGLYPDRIVNPPIIEAERIAAAERIRRPCIYLGTLNGHFGHFLVESLARSWALSHIDRGVGAVFHFANFAGAPDIAQLLGTFPGYITTTLDLLGLTPSRIELANRDLRFDNLYVPTAQFWINHFGGPGLSEVYDDIREEIVRRTGLPVGPSRKLYLTRRKLTDPQPHKIRKNIANEDEIEELFLAQGFESVALEQMSFPEQIMVMATASHIAGTTGSALHMAMFTAQPEAELIGIDWRNSRTQYILDAARGLRAHHIYCFRGRDDRGAPLVDADTVAAALADVMSPSGAPGGPRQVYATALEAQLARRSQSLADRKALAADVSLIVPAAPPPPSLSSDDGLEKLKRYSEVRPDGSRMARQTPAIWLLLDAIQTSLGIEGDILDVGAGLGATAVLGAMLLKPGECAVAIDRAQHPSFSRSLEALPPDVKDRIRFDAVGPDDLAAAALPPSGFRLAHIDAHLRTDRLMAQIEAAAPALRPDGLLVFNDFFEPSSPDVTTAVYDLLRGDEWRVVAIAFNKAYLARAQSKLVYAQALEREAKVYLAAFGAFAVNHEVILAGDKVCALKGNLRAALLAHEAR